MPLSATQISQALSRTGDDPWIALLTLQHEGLNGGVPVRLARNPTADIISNGLTFSKHGSSLSYLLMTRLLQSAGSQS